MVYIPCAEVRVPCAPYSCYQQSEGLRFWSDGLHASCGSEGLHAPLTHGLSKVRVSIFGVRVAMQFAEVRFYMLPLTHGLIKVSASVFRSEGCHSICGNEGLHAPYTYDLGKVKVSICVLHYRK